MEVESKAKQREMRNVIKNKYYKKRLSEIKECNSICEEDEENDDYDENCMDDLESDFKEKIKLSSDESDDEECTSNLNVEAKEDTTHTLNKDILMYKKEMDNIQTTLQKRNIMKTSTSKKESHATIDDKLKAVIEKCKANNKKTKTILYTDIMPMKTKSQPVNEITKETPPLIIVNDNEWQKVKTNIKQWLTLETYILLHGYNKIKEYLNETTISKYFDDLKVNELKTQQQLKYMQICKRLQLHEIAEEKFDKMLKSDQLNPLPNYQKLKQESKEMNLKVHSFYEGTLFEENDSNFPIKKIDEENEQVTLPLTDSSSQHALRRRVLITRIQKMYEKFNQIS